MALPGKPHAGDDAVDDPILVGIGIDDRRAFAAEFQRHRHDPLGRRAHDDLADLGRAGEGQLAHQRVLRQRPAAFLAKPGQDVEHAGGKKLLARLGHHQYAERCVFGGLQHQCVAGAQGGRDLQRAEQYWRVPWNDRADHPKRLTARIAQHLLAERDRLALQLAGEATEVAEDIRRQPRLAARLGSERIPGFERDRAGEFFGLRLQLVRDPQQEAPAVARRNFAPAREGACGCLNRAVDIGGVAARHLGDRPPLRRVLDGQGIA